MKGLIRIITIFLVVFLITGSLVACQKVSEGNVEQDVSFDLTKELIASYTVIIPSQTDENMTAVASFLQMMLEQSLGVKPEIKTDEAEEAEHEILIGLTNRKESAELYGNLKEREYGYALVGKKLLIVGNDANAVKEGLLLFKADALDKADTQSVLLAANSQKLTEQEGKSQPQYTYYADVLKGVTVNAIGDSYFNYSKMDKSQVWLSLLADKYNMRMNNYGKGGSTVSNYNPKTPMCERYTEMFSRDADIILIEGGANDIARYTPIGEVDSADTKTFSGALNVIIDGVQERYPNAMIVCITTWNIYDGFYGDGTIGYMEYANAMEAVAKRQDIYFIPAYDTNVTGVDMCDPSFRAKYCMSASDANHLNAEGMKIAMSHFEKVLAEYYLDFLSKK